MNSYYRLANHQLVFLGTGRFWSNIALVVAGLLALGLAHSATAQTLLAGYDFQTTTNGGTAAAAAPGAPLAYLAGFGTEAGTAGLYLDGTHGSSTFTSLSSNPQVTGFGGSALNTAGTSFSTSTAGASALAVGNNSSNGKSIVFALSTTGYMNLVLSFATQSTASGFKGNTFSYSTDGTTFTPFTGTNGTVNPPSSYAVTTVDFSSITALNNAATVYIEYTLAGATGGSGNERFDNIQFDADVPEPTTLLGGALALGAFGWSQRRRVLSLCRLNFA